MKKMLLTSISLALTLSVFSDDANTEQVLSQESYRDRLERRRQELIAARGEQEARGEQTPNNLTSPPLKPNPAFGFYYTSPPPPISKDDPNYQNFSEKAIELISHYRIYPNGPRTHAYPPLDSKKHINEEYRPAWEELYRESMNTTRGLSVNPITALSLIGSPNSIPMLVEVYNDTQVKKGMWWGPHRTAINILFTIDAPEALDAALSLIDTTEKISGAKPAADLREEHLKNLERALQKENLKTYQNPNISAKNKAFLEKVRASIRASEEQKTNADTP